MKRASQTPTTTLFKRKVRAGSQARYEEWLTGIAQTAARFPGSQGTTILQPTEEGTEYWALTQFESTESLAAWLSSAERESWMSRLRAIDVCSEDVATLFGMERRFTLPPSTGAPPPRYKTATLVLAGLYPLLLALDLVLGPLLSDLPRPVSLLASLLVSVPIMVWAVLPWLTRLFGAWLDPCASRVDDTGDRDECLPHGNAEERRTEFSTAD